MVLLQGVELGSVVGLIPTVSMILCSMVASRVKTNPEIEAIFQNFAAGLIIAAVAAELFPLLFNDANTGLPLHRKDQIGGITIGFIVSLGLIYGLDYFLDGFEDEEVHVIDTAKNAIVEHAGLENGKPVVDLEASLRKYEERNKEFYKKIADTQGIDLAEKEKSHLQDSPSSSPGKPGANLGDIELRDRSASNHSDSNKQTADPDPTAFVGYGVDGLPSRWEDDDHIREASQAISDPRHRAHVFEHVKELSEAVQALVIKSNKITEVDGKTASGLTLKDTDQLAEEMDQGVHNLQYLLDHCRRLLQGTEFDFGAIEGNAPITFNRMSEEKKMQLKKRVQVLAYTARHILEHVMEGEEITADVLQEIYMHMDEMEKHLEFFHDSVQNLAARWSKRHQLPTPELGAFLPMGLVVPVVMDCFTDGLLIGVTCALKAEAGIILGAANCLEMGFLGIAYSWRIEKCTGTSYTNRTVALYAPALVMWGSAVLGAFIAGATKNKPVIFISFVAFGVVALLYLVCNELLIEAREAQGKDGKWWVSIWIFVAVWLVLVTAPSFDE